MLVLVWLALLLLEAELDPGKLVSAMVVSGVVDVVVGLLLASWGISWVTMECIWVICCCMSAICFGVYFLDSASSLRNWVISVWSVPVLMVLLTSFFTICAIPWLRVSNSARVTALSLHGRRRAMTEKWRLLYSWSATGRSWLETCPKGQESLLLIQYRRRSR